MPFIDPDDVGKKGLVGPAEFPRIPWSGPLYPTEGAMRTAMVGVEEEGQPQGKGGGGFVDPDEMGGGEEAPAAEKPGFWKSFSGSLKNPIQAMREENILVNIQKAKEKGLFDKPWKEIYHDATKEVADLSLKQVWEAAKADPGKFAAEFVNGVFADPELLLVPMGFGGTLAKAGGRVLGTAGKVVGHAAEAAAMGGLQAGAISEASQLAHEGFIDPKRLGQETGLGAVFGAGFGAAIHLGAAIAGKSAGAVEAGVREKIKRGMDPAEALREQLKGMGLAEEKAAEVATPVEDWIKEKVAGWEKAKKEAKASELAPNVKLEYGEAPLAEEPPKAALPEVPEPAKGPLSRGVELGEESALAKEPFQRHAEDLVSIQKAQQLREEGYRPILTPDDLLAQEPSGKGLVDVDGRPFTPDAAAEEVRRMPLELVGQRGVIDPEFAKWLALGAGGVVAGAYAFQHPEQAKEGLLMGGALLGTRVPGFYSGALKAFNQVVKRGKGTAEEWGKELGNLKGGGAQEELEAIGVGDWLKAQGDRKVTKEEVRDFILGGGVQLEETKLGDRVEPVLSARQDAGGWTVRDAVTGREWWDGDSQTAEQAISSTRAYQEQNMGIFDQPTRFHSYQLPGGENYRELLLTLPEKEKGNFHAGHFDEPNILAHVRFNDRTDASGAKVLFLEELQSDWAQKGRREGFEAGVPKAPFVTDTEAWTSLALRRMLRYAVDKGYDKIAWTTGEQQAARYDLSKQISELHYSGSNLKAYDHSGEEIISHTGVRPEDLPDMVGKEIADRLMKQEPQGTLRSLHGLDLKVGGEGMKTFYDKIVGGVARKIAKRLGGEIGYAEITPLDPDRARINAKQAKLGLVQRFVTEQPAIIITPQMKAKIEGGMPLFGREGGKIDPKLAAAMGAGAAGALAGGYLSDDKPTGMALGAALGLGGAVAGRAVAKLGRQAVEKAVSLKEATPLRKSTHIPIDGVRREWQGDIGTSARHIDGLVYGLKKLVPDQTRREALTHFIQGDRTAEVAPRSQAERDYVQTVKQVYAGLGRKGQQAGVLDKLIGDSTYITQLWEKGDVPPGVFARLFEGEGKRAPMSPNSPFALDRVLPSYRKGIDLGLKPKTLDSAEILGIYGRSLNKSIANKKLLGSLKEMEIPDAGKLILPDKKAPADYVGVMHPQLAGLRVHPDIADSVKMLFYSDDPFAMTRALQTISTTAKRGIFSYSMFHAKSLFDGLLGASRLFRQGPKAWAKVPEAFRALKHPVEGDVVDQAIRDGVVIDPRHGIDQSNDILRQVVGGMIRKVSAVHPSLAVPLKGLDWLDERLNHFTWGVVHPTFKIATHMAEKERGLLNAKGRTPEQIGRQVASYVNDIFGGQNWVELAEGVENRYGRKLAMMVAHPAGRRALQIAMLAPDWTISTFRSALKALPGVTEPEIAAMHRSYMVSSALLYLTIGDLVNYKMSGHHLWENKDPTYIDLGDGRRMQLNKHFMETFHWLMHPGQVALNKLGYLPKEAIEQAMHKEYLTEDGGPPMKGGRLAHAVKGFLPITLSQQSPGSAVAGFLGVPVYGRTDEEKAAAKEAAKEKAREKRRAQRFSHERKEMR